MLFIQRGQKGVIISADLVRGDGEVISELGKIKMKSESDDYGSVIIDQIEEYINNQDDIIKRELLDR